MQKILRKRIIRDFRENIWRYLALGGLIILCMYLIVSITAGAETIMDGVTYYGNKNHVEDGQFHVFVPLTREEEKKITKEGVLLEKQFYLDFSQKKEKVLRVFAERKKINTIELDQGTMAKQKNEVVLEKRYCAENHISCKDTVTIGGKNFVVTGIGSVPDYDAPYRDFAAISVESSQFGLAFVTENAYHMLKKSKKSIQSEEYVYSYRLLDGMTQKALKKKLQKLEFDPDEVEDSYFQKYWKENTEKREELKEGIGKLSDGSGNLYKGLGTLSKNNGLLKKAANSLFLSYLAQAKEGLRDYGLQGDLTRRNYEEQLTKIKEQAQSSLVAMKIDSIKEELQVLDQYAQAVGKYTDGVGKAKEGSQKIAKGMKTLEEKTNQLLDQNFSTDMSNLKQFIKKEDNQRIAASANDQIINKYAAMIAGVILIILIAYVISVFVIHGIEKESSVIGALYALGVRKKDLLVHYIALPAVVVFVASIIGCSIGMSKWGIDTQTADCYRYFSFPQLKNSYPAYLLVYSLVLPVALTICVNYFVITKKLSKTALSLLRKEQKISKSGRISLGNMKFIHRYQIRQILREKRSGLTVIGGMFISLLIVMLSLDCLVMCQNIYEETQTDTKYNYMYSYKYPPKKKEKGGKETYAYGLTKEYLGYTNDVTLLGITKENPYFDAKVKKKKNSIVLSSAAAEKFNLHVGEKVILRDQEEEQDYVFQVDGICNYSTALYAFMDIDAMRELFGQQDDYYNTVFSTTALKIPKGRLYATTTRKEIVKSSRVFVKMMWPMILMLGVVSALIFCVVMYLMIKVMIDRSAFQISLLKIFGFRKKEIKKLYLNGNLYIILLGALLTIPASKWIMDSMYPVLVANVACGMNLTFPWWMYAGLFVAIVGLYLVVNQLLVRRINQCTPGEVLKNRE